LKEFSIDEENIAERLFISYRYINKLFEKFAVVLNILGNITTD
jgi:hypothetical protein